MKAKIYRFLLRILPLFNRFPFWNTIRLGGAKFHCKGAALARCKVDCKGKNNVIRLGKDTRITGCHIYIRGDNNVIELGQQAHAKDAEFYIEDNGNRITIGDRTNLCGQIHLACTEGKAITIGEDCLFSSQIVFRTGDSHSILDADGNRINPARDITVADRVWLGHRVLLNKGVHIPADSVVGTGAVVTKAFHDPHVILAGVPAKVVKENISWSGHR